MTRRKGTRPTPQALRTSEAFMPAPRRVGDNLKTTGGIKTPLGQTGDERLKDLLGWTRPNRDKVWAMPCGDLDPKLQ